MTNRPNRSSIHRITAGLTAAAAMLAFTACSAPAESDDTSEPIVFQWGTSSDISEPFYVAAKAAADAIEERSEGRLHIDIYPNEQLGTLPEMHEQAAAGAPLILDTNPGFASEYGSAGMGILQGPYLFDSYDQISAFSDSDLMAEWADELSSGGLHSFAWNWYYGQRQLIGHESYASPKALEGKLVRVSGNAVQATLFRAMGATPVELGRSEIYSGLSQGVVQASDGPIPQLLGDSLFEVADQITLTSHVDMLTGILVGAKAFDALPPDLQEILTDEIKKAGAMFTDLQAESIKKDRKALEDLGVTFNEADKAAYKALSAIFYDGTANPAWTQELRDRVLKAAAG